MVLLSALTSEKDLHFLSPVAQSVVILAIWFILALCTFPVGKRDAVKKNRTSQMKMPVKGSDGETPVK